MKIKVTLWKSAVLFLLLFMLGVPQNSSAGIISFGSARQTQDINVMPLTNTPLGKGTANQRILLVGVMTDTIAGTGAAQAVTKLNFTLTGSSNVEKLTVYMGGLYSNDPNFSTVFGSVTSLGSTVSVNGSYTLTNANSGTYAGADDARFLVLIDLKEGANVGDKIDIVCDSMLVGGVSQTSIPGTVAAMASYATVSERLAGTKTIKATGGDYANIKSAITDINNRGIGTDGVELVLDDDATYTVGSYDLNTPYLYIRAQSSESSPLTIRRSGTGTNRPIINMPSNTSVVLGFLGSDYVTIDGLSIINTGISCPKGITFQGLPKDGCNNNVVKNCYLDLKNANTSSNTIAISFLSAAASAEGTFSNNKVFNNQCMNMDAGIAFNPPGNGYLFKSENNEIYNNTISGIFGLNNGGICIASCKNTKVYNNTLDGSGATIAFQTAKGIEAAYVNNNSDNTGYFYCYGNTVKNMRTISKNNQARIIGINLMAPEVYVFNNMISNLKADSTTCANVGAYASCGLVLNTNGSYTPVYYVWNNSVYLNQVTPGTAFMTALSINGSGTINAILNNNIFVNTSTGSTNNRVVYSSKPASNIGTGSDNNLYYPEFANFIYTYSTLADYKAALVSASKDQNSISVMPPFVSESDLHLVGGSTLINNGGKALEKVTTDIDGNVRNTTTPDLGADEIVPAINVSATKLDGYSYEEGKGPSAEQSFKVSGSTLVGDITVTPSTNYELLVPNGDSYDVINSIVLTQTNGVVKDSSVFVRLKAGLSKGDYNAEKVIISTNEATAKNVICNGTVLFGTLLESISKEKALNLYPNPAISDVTISSDRQVQYVELIDMDGRVSKRIDAGFTNNINISDLSAGLYLVRVKTNEGFKYGKLTVK